MKKTMLMAIITAACLQPSFAKEGFMADPLKSINAHIAEINQTSCKTKECWIGNLQTKWKSLKTKLIEGIGAPEGIIAEYQDSLDTAIQDMESESLQQVLANEKAQLTSVLRDFEGGGALAILDYFGKLPAHALPDTTLDSIGFNMLISGYTDPDFVILNDYSFIIEGSYYEIYKK